MSRRKKTQPSRLEEFSAQAEEEERQRREAERQARERMDRGERCRQAARAFISATNILGPEGISAAYRSLVEACKALKEAGRLPVKALKPWPPSSGLTHMFEARSS